MITAALPDQAAADHPDERAVASETVRTVHAALQALTPEQRHVVTLRFLAELSAPEVAGVMGTTEGAVRALQRRGVAAMARRLSAAPVPVGLPPALEG